MTTTIAVLNEKGGVGKSMLAQNIAAWAHHRAGRRTLLRDADGQGTSRDWYRMRGAESALAGLRVEHAPVVADWRLDKVAEASEGFDLVVCDGPHDLGAVTTAAAFVADIVVVPIRPQHADLWALEHTVTRLALVREAREARGVPGPRVLVVLNEVRPRERDLVAARASVGELGLALLDSFLTHRVVYDRARGAGEAAATSADDAARAEVRALYNALLGGIS